MSDAYGLSNKKFYSAKESELRRKTGLGFTACNDRRSITEVFSLLGWCFERYAQARGHLGVKAEDLRQFGSTLTCVGPIMEVSVNPFEKRPFESIVCRCEKRHYKAIRT